MSGGFSGQVSVYGLPSGRLLKVIPVFSQNPENGWGYNEETKPMLQTTYGFIPWDDTHHTELSQTDGVPNGKLALHQRQQHAAHRAHRPHALRDGRDHPDSRTPPAVTRRRSRRRTESSSCRRRASACRFPTPTSRSPTTRQNFKGTLSFITADQPGKMDIAFQIMMPGYDYDLGHAGKGSVGRLVLLHVVQQRAGEHQARGERVAERQGLHRRGELQARRSMRRRGQGEDVPVRVHAQLHGREEPVGKVARRRRA